MAETAESGLMFWDGKSKGTVKNVVSLSRDHKPVVRRADIGRCHC